MRPVVVIDSLSEQGASTEYPAAVLCIVQVRRPTPHGDAMPPHAEEDEDVALCQWFDDDPRGRNGFVPKATYV